MDKLFTKDKKGKGKECEERTGKSEYNAIAWVNDMGRDRYGDASGRLLEEAAGAGDLGVRHVRAWMFSSHDRALTFSSLTLVHAIPREAFPPCKLARRWHVGREDARWCVAILLLGHCSLTTFVVAFHDGLDFIAVQEKLLAEFQSVVGSMRGKQKNSLDAQLDAVLSAKAKKLKESERKGLTMVCV